MLQNDLRQRTAGNMGLSAMLADEYMLIDVRTIRKRQNCCPQDKQSGRKIFLS